MAAQVPASDSGTVTPAAIVGVMRRRNTNTTSITSRTVASSVYCMSSTLARMVLVRSDRIEMSMPAGNPALQLGDQRADLVDGLDDVGVALLGDVEQDRRLAVEPGGRAAVARAVLDAGDVAQPDDVAVPAFLTTMWPIVRRRAQLLVGGDRLACRVPSKLPSGVKLLALTMASRTSSSEIPPRRSRPD